MVKGLFRGCLIGVGILIVISAIGAMVGGGKTPAADVATVAVPLTQTIAPQPTVASEPTATQVPESTAAPAVDAPVPGSAPYPCQPGQLKANINSKIYHAPGQRDYEKTQANVVCFDTAAEADAAGYRAAKR